MELSNSVPFQNAKAENTIEQDDDSDVGFEHEGEIELVTSYRNANYESSEMKHLLYLTEPVVELPVGLHDVSYKSSKVFPDWVLKNSNWKQAAVLEATQHSVPEIMKLDKNKRNADQNTLVIKWLMSVWKIAFTMGFKRCGSMLKAFEYCAYAPGEDIITEGERGLTFFIVISGDTEVYKEGIGKVGNLGKGKSFGEVALTQGNDLRTATVRAGTQVECIRLHKSNFDYFVRNIQEQEKRENFKILSDCKLFKTWPNGKIEKMSNSCVRSILDKGDYVFKQGDNPDSLYVIVEGNVDIIKELVIVCRNRWPVGVRQWQDRTKRINKPILVKTLGTSDFFGEMAILKNQQRSSSAVATNRCVLLKLGRLEFLHLISYGNTGIDADFIANEDQKFKAIVNKYISDEKILMSVGYLVGGPDSQAQLGEHSLYKHDMNETPNADIGSLGLHSRGQHYDNKGFSIVTNSRDSSPTGHNQGNSNTGKNTPTSAARAKPGSPKRGRPVPRRGHSHQRKTTTVLRAKAPGMPKLTVQEELAKANKSNELLAKLQISAHQTLQNEKLKQEYARNLYGAGPTVRTIHTHQLSPKFRNTLASAARTPGGSAHRFKQEEVEDAFDLKAMIEETAQKGGVGRNYRKQSMVDNNGLIYRKHSIVFSKAAKNGGTAANTAATATSATGSDSPVVDRVTGRSTRGSLSFGTKEEAAAALGLSTALATFNEDALGTLTELSFASDSGDGGGREAHPAAYRPNRRKSLQGVDNDVNFNVDPTMVAPKVVLSQTSAIDVNKVYEHVFQTFRDACPSDSYPSTVDAGSPGSGGVRRGMSTKTALGGPSSRPRTAAAAASTKAGGGGGGGGAAAYIAAKAKSMSPLAGVGEAVHLESTNTTNNRRPFTANSAMTGQTRTPSPPTATAAAAVGSGMAAVAANRRISTGASKLRPNSSSSHIGRSSSKQQQLGGEGNQQRMLAQLQSYMAASARGGGGGAGGGGGHASQKLRFGRDSSLPSAESWGAALQSSMRAMLVHQQSLQQLQNYQTAQSRSGDEEQPQGGSDAMGTAGTAGTGGGGGGGGAIDSQAGGAGGAGGGGGGGGAAAVLYMSPASYYHNLAAAEAYEDVCKSRDDGDRPVGVGINSGGAFSAGFFNYYNNLDQGNNSKPSSAPAAIAGVPVGAGAGSGAAAAAFLHSPAGKHCHPHFFPPSDDDDQQHSDSFQRNGDDDEFVPLQSARPALSAGQIRRKSLQSGGSAKILNKAKISYRDAMDS